MKPTHQVVTKSNSRWNLNVMRAEELAQFGQIVGKVLLCVVLLYSLYDQLIGVLG